MKSALDAHKLAVCLSLSLMVGSAFRAVPTVPRGRRASTRTLLPAPAAPSLGGALTRAGPTHQQYMADIVMRIRWDPKIAFPL